MTDRGEGEGELPPTLERLGSLVVKKSSETVWRSFCVAQATSRHTERRREMTTQRIFLTGLSSQLPER
jgi:hypothetical protein